MARTPVSEDSEDTLFRIFDHAQGAQRRIFRLIARGFYNRHGLNELRAQLSGALDEVDDLLKAVED